MIYIYIYICIYTYNYIGSAWRHPPFLSAAFSEFAVQRFAVQRLYTSVCFWIAVPIFTVQRFHNLESKDLGMENENREWLWENESRE